MISAKEIRKMQHAQEGEIRKYLEENCTKAIEEKIIQAVRLGKTEAQIHTCYAPWTNRYSMKQLEDQFQNALKSLLSQHGYSYAFNKVHNLHIIRW